MIEGVLIKPADFDASKTYPLVVLIHGGPPNDRQYVVAVAHRVHGVVVIFRVGRIDSEERYVAPVLATGELRGYHLLPAARADVLRRLALGRSNADIAADLPVPPALRALFESFEAGESMVDVRVGSWRELAPGTGRLTRFIVPRELVRAAVERTRATFGERAGDPSPGPLRRDQGLGRQPGPPGG